MAHEKIDDKSLLELINLVNEDKNQAIGENRRANSKKTADCIPDDGTRGALTNILIQSLCNDEEYTDLVENHFRGADAYRSARAKGFCQLTLPLNIFSSEKDYAEKFSLNELLAEADSEMKANIAAGLRNVESYMFLLTHFFLGDLTYYLTRIALIELAGIIEALLVTCSSRYEGVLRNIPEDFLSDENVQTLEEVGLSCAPANGGLLFRYTENGETEEYFFHLKDITLGSFDPGSGTTGRIIPHLNGELSRPLYNGSNSRKKARELGKWISRSNKKKLETFTERLFAKGDAHISDYVGDTFQTYQDLFTSMKDLRNKVHMIAVEGKVKDKEEYASLEQLENMYSLLIITIEALKEYNAE